MAARELIFAGLLLIAGALVARGAYMLDPAVGLIVGGAALAVWSWLVLGDIEERS